MFKKGLCYFLSTIMVISMVVIFSPVIALADDGTAFNGPHNVPGTIQAEDFNNGGQYVAYFANTTGNQGNSTYRSTDVDIYDDGTNKYIKSSSSYGEAKEWVKYTIEVGTAGWFKIEYSARHDGGTSSHKIQTVLDDRQLGQVRVPAQSTFTTLNGPQTVYLSAGTHVLKVAIHDGATSLNSITISSITTPSFPSPQIATSPQTTDEVVVADAVVTNSPFNADSTGVNDSTSAIQSAIDTVWKMGGGTVFIPAGKYRIDGTLTLPESITLRGDWKSPLSGGSGQGTILKASSGIDNESGAPFMDPMCV